MRGSKGAVWRLLILGVAAPLLASAGCGRHQAALRVVNWAGPEELEIERRNIADFRQRHPGVQVHLETIPSNYREKLLTSFAAGTSPDVFLLDATVVPALLDRGALLDLAPYCRKRGFDLSQYYPNVLAIAKRGDRVYALPKDFTPLVLFFNKDLFDSGGVPYPKGDWTWDQFLNVARRLTIDRDSDQKPDQYGTLTYPEASYWPPWIWSNGGGFLDPTGTHASGYLNSPQTVQALQFLVDLYRKYAVAPSPAAAKAMGEEVSLLYTQRVAMAVSGHWLFPKLQKSIREGRLRVGVAPIPHPVGKKPVTVLYEAGWAVSAQTRQPELAAELAMFLGSVGANRRRLSQRLAIPANISLAQEALSTDGTGLESVFYDQIPRARMPWGAIVEKFSHVEDVAQDAFEQSLIGGRDLREGLTQAAARVDAELAEAQPKQGSQRAQVLLFVVGCLFAVFVGVAALTALSRGAHRREAMRGWAFLAPSLVLVIVFSLAPLVFSLYLAFHRWNIVDPTTPFVGVRNFGELMRDGEFWKAMGNTAIFTLHVPIAMALSLLVAMLLNRPMRGVAVLRTLFFLPSVSSLVAIAIVWHWLYNPDYGLFNYVLKSLGLRPVGWLTDPRWALLSVMLMSIWGSVGYQMVLFLAGLQGVPSHLYEAAALDGAGPWHRFRHITLPMLKPTSLFVLVTSVIASWQVFTPVYVMTQGGPLGATDVVVFHIYRNAWEYLRMGYASAMAWVLFVILMVATYLQFRYVGKEVEL